MEVPKRNQFFNKPSKDDKLSHQSKHFLLELYRCDFEKLNDDNSTASLLYNYQKVTFN